MQKCSGYSHVTPGYRLWPDEPEGSGHTLTLLIYQVLSEQLVTHSIQFFAHSGFGKYLGYFGQ